MTWDARLPWPPLESDHFHASHGGRAASVTGTQYRREVASAIVQSRNAREHVRRLDVDVTFHPPTAHDYDLFQRVPAVIDAITKVGIIIEPAQIFSCTWRRGEPVDAGAVALRIDERA